MRKQSLLLNLIVVSTLVALFFSSPTFSAGGGKYLMGSGDLIRIHVFDEDDLTIETRVGDSGTVSYPFLGEIQVSGLTAMQLQNTITKRLKGPYLVNPVVTVSILEYRPFFVNGKVEKPGGFPFQPGMTVRNAISLAGGFQERADKDKIFIVPGDQPGAEPRHVTLGDLVMPGDTVTVERSFF